MVPKPSGGAATTFASNSLEESDVLATLEGLKPSTPSNDLLLDLEDLGFLEEP